MELSNPFSQMLLSAVPHFFFGRRADVETILHGITSNQPRSFSLQGPRMIGKTTLLKYLIHPSGALHNYRSSILEYGPRHGGKISFLYLDLYKQTGSQIIDALHFALKKNSDISNILDSPSEDMSNKNDNVKKKNILEMFKSLEAKSIRPVICLDHFDVAFSTMEYEVDNFLRSLTIYSSIIIVTEKSLTELRIEAMASSPLLTILVGRVIGLLTEHEARELITSPMKKSDIKFSDVEVDFLLRMSGRHPYLLTLISAYWFELHANYPEDARAITDNDIRNKMKLRLVSLPTISEFFNLLWRRLQVDEQNVIYKVATGVKHDEDLVLNRLFHESLVSLNTASGSYSLFSEIFQKFVLQTKGQRLDNITGLSQLDRRLLLYLAEKSGALCTFDELLRDVWGDSDGSKRAVEAAIHRIRSYLQNTDQQSDDMELIQNVRGKGYIYKPKL